MFRVFLLILICFGLSGCATISPQYGYSGKDLSDIHLKKFNDEQILILFDRIYNEPVKTKSENIAKDITVTAFMIALEHRSQQSSLIKDSGILNRPYKRVELNKWTDADLVDTYNSISEERDKMKAKPKEDKDSDKFTDMGGKTYWLLKKTPDKEESKEVSSSADDETTLEIIQLTALFAIDSELRRRDVVKHTWQKVGSATITGISAAAKVAMLLAGLLI